MSAYLDSGLSRGLGGRLRGRLGGDLARGFLLRKLQGTRWA
jgi:hypothetical protein